MLQSHAKQLQTKYMTVLRRETDLRPEDIGAVRMVVGMALSEMQDEHRQQLNDMDDITADLLKERDQLKAAAATDAGEILRLQTMEDRLVAWLSEHEPELAFDNSYERDIAAAIIDLLSKRGSATVAPPPAPVALNANGNGNGHVQITDLGTRYTGRRLNMTDDEVRSFALDKIRRLAAQLGHTPTQSDWNKHIEADEPSLAGVKNRLRKNWNDLVKAAGLEPNLNSHQIAAQKNATEQDEEARTDDAASTFRGQ